MPCGQQLSSVVVVVQVNLEEFWLCAGLVCIMVVLAVELLNIVAVSVTVLEFVDCHK